MRTIDDGPTARLALSCVALIASVAAACCFSTVWSYWYHELDADCPDRGDCKCVLFGTSLSDGFVGGERSACRHVLYSALASAALAASATAYYGCRSLLCRHRRRPADRPRRRRDRHHVQLQSPLPPPSSSARPDDRNVSPQITGLDVCFAIALGLMALNMFIASIVVSNGYISTCQQYVHRVKSFLMVSGNMVELVSNRMSCGTVYDFLDYLQPPSRQVTYELIHRHKTNPRDYVIDTSLLLIVCIVTSWLSTAIWITFACFVLLFKKTNESLFV